MESEVFYLPVKQIKLSRANVCKQNQKTQFVSAQGHPKCLIARLASETKRRLPLVLSLYFWGPCKGTTTWAGTATGPETVYIYTRNIQERVVGHGLMRAHVHIRRQNHTRAHDS